MTEDGRHIIVGGRTWRATDPAIPDGLKQELVNELMSARRAIKRGDLTARRRVQAAKTALGERGEPWWEQTSEGRKRRAVDVINTLLRARPDGAVTSVEVARVIGGDDYIDLVETVMREQDEEAWLLDDGSPLSVSRRDDS